MLNLTVACVGTLKERYLRDAAAEYAKRLSPYCKLNIVEVNEARVPENPYLAQINSALAEEGSRLLAKIPSGAYVITLCIEGDTLSSEELGQRLNKITVNGASHIVMVIGGSWGLSPEVKKRADFRLSLSRMTFPHQLTRVMLLEQTYRAFQINLGGKYHK